MSWDSLVYLTGFYWPYLGGAAIIGLVTGWLSFKPPTSGGGA